MRVQIDPARCQGHAKCWAEAPEVFQLDDEGFASATTGDIPSEAEGRARWAVQNCPERAIRVVDDVTA